MTRAHLAEPNRESEGAQYAKKLKRDVMISNNNFFRKFKREKFTNVVLRRESIMDYIRICNLLFKERQKWESTG
jgi:hypothetical protein